MPAGIAVNCARLGLQLVGAELAQLLQADCERGAGSFRAEPLCHRDERDAVKVAARTDDAAPHRGQVLGDAVGVYRVPARHTTIAWRSFSPRARCEK